MSICIYVYSTCVEIDSNKVENVDNFEIDRCMGFQYIQAENIHTHIGLIFHWKGSIKGQWSRSKAFKNFTENTNGETKENRKGK